MTNASLEIFATLFSLVKLSESQREAYAQVSAVDAQALVRYAYRECKSSPLGAVVLQEIVQRAEVSDVPLSQWVSQLVAVYQWLEIRQLEASIRDIIDYVGCACEGSGLQAGHSIDWYLDQYGFERAR